MQEFITFISSHMLLSAGFVVILALLIANELMGRMTGGKKCSVSLLSQLVNSHEAKVIDVRNKADFKQGHIVDSVSIPQKELSEKLSKITNYKQKPVIIVDANGTQGHTASSVVKKQGFENVYYLNGGIAAWRQQSFPLTKK